MIYMNEATYHRLREEYSGICLSCLHVRHGDTEPDAENYQCENCDKERVQGIENLMICGIVAVDDQTDKPYAKMRSGNIREVVF